MGRQSRRPIFALLSAPQRVFLGHAGYDEAGIRDDHDVSTRKCCYNERRSDVARKPISLGQRRFVTQASWKAKKAIGILARQR